ncbi:SAP30-binding protein [Dirofilaria immitis]|nr:SAP30-binding protein [Dirofilaria immitis]
MDKARQTSTEIVKEISRKEERRNSEYWTDESANESSSSNADSSMGSGTQSDFDAAISPSQNQSRSFASKNTLYMTQSQTSLVSYAEQEDEEDQFARADRKAVANKQTEEKDSSESTNREPKPPPGHEDSRSPDEIAVDSAVEEGLRELSKIHDEPIEIRLPPSPTAKCSAELEKFEVDELGSNFAPSVFDPHGFTKDCFYDQISTEAKRKSRFEGTKNDLLIILITVGSYNNPK